jgi:hypothetical protein
MKVPEKMSGPGKVAGAISPIWHALHLWKSADILRAITEDPETYKMQENGMSSINNLAAIPLTFYTFRDSYIASRREKLFWIETLIFT